MKINEVPFALIDKVQFIKTIGDCKRLISRIYEIEFENGERELQLQPEN